MRFLIGLFFSILSVAANAQTSVSPPDLSPYVKSVQQIGPDATGNVAGIATSTQFTGLSSQLSNVMIAGDVIQVVTPSTGATVTPSAGVTVLLVNNPSLLAALTVMMPASGRRNAADPVRGHD